MSSFSNFMLAFCSRRFAEIRDCFSLVSTIIGILGFGQVTSFGVDVFEKMFSIGFIFVCDFLLCR